MNDRSREAVLQKAAEQLGSDAVSEKLFRKTLCVEILCLISSEVVPVDCTHPIEGFEKGV